MGRRFERRVRGWLVGVAFFGALACNGGGCSSCDGCAVQPIPGGYPIDERVENTSQLRVTESGFAFLEDNADAFVAALLGPDGLEFDVSSDDICSSGGCYIRGEITDARLDPEVPNRLIVDVDVVLTSRDESGDRAPIRDACQDVFGFPVCCDVDVDTNGGDRPHIGLIATIDFLEETRAAREGYTRVVVSAGNGDSYFAEGEGIQSGDFSLEGGCGWADFDFVKEFIANQIDSQVRDQVQEAIDDGLCTKQGEYGCPTGTEPEDGSADPDATCVFAATEECVPVLLGADGQGDLGAAALGALSPGTHAPGQFLMALGGEGTVETGGMSFTAFGGFRGTDATFMTTPAHSSCVPVVEPPPLPTVPRVDAFRANTIPGTDEPAHVAFGIAESFLDHGAYHLFDGGMLCLGVGTRLNQQLSTGLFSILIGSLSDLTFPEDSAPLSIALRPQQPPSIEIGDTAAGDPLMTVHLPEVEIDFYVWSTERYIRFMTYKADLTIPIGLSVEDGELVPAIDDIVAENSSVMNSELLEESPEMLADVLETVISMFAGMAAGSVGGFALPELGGIQLEVPERGIVGFEEMGEEFIGVFATLAVPPPGGAYTATAETRISTGRLTIDPRAAELATWGEGEPPAFDLELGAQGGPAGAEYEYSWRLDGLTWSPWTRANRVTVRSDALLMQARHVVEARARVVGAPRTVDRSPARHEVLVDLLAPNVGLEPRGSRLVVRAHDLITPPPALEYRTRLDDGIWTAWQSLAEGLELAPPESARRVRVEVRDEAGNVGRSELDVGGAQAALIRGGPNPNAESCTCTVPGGGPGPSGATWLLGLVGLATVLARRRRRRPRGAAGARRRPGHGLLMLAIALALTVSGCNCGNGGGRTPPPDGSTPRMCDETCGMNDSESDLGSACCEPESACIEYDLVALCDGSMICRGHDAVSLDETCGAVCGECIMPAPLDPGILATYLDVTSMDDGSFALSGYAPGVAGGPRYGDLVVGTMGAGGGEAAWDLVDGVPDGPSRGDPTGWRAGVRAAGEDVGQWTSIAHAGDTLYVSYYDRTNGALKLAIRSGGSWSTQVVDDTGDSGRYSAITLMNGSVPAIAYMQVEPPESAPGKPVGRARVARASSPMPAPEAWSSDVVHEIEIDCRPAFCGEGQACLESGQCAVPTADCAGECTDDQACFMGTCEGALADPYVEDMPPATGMYNALVAVDGGLALVFYERATGNLRGTRWDGSTWSAPFLIDGWERNDPAVGDSGIGASLFVDSAGAWHVSYADGAEETLRYARVEGTNVAAELVDDGTSDGTTAHTDGRHIVGDDSSIVVTGDGEVRIAYQDATMQHAMLARRPAGGEWSIAVLDDVGHTGFWLEQEPVAGGSAVLTFWRGPAGSGDSGVRVLDVN